jgi:hypothetical protein
MGFVLAMLVLGVSASQSRTKHSPGSNIGRWSWGFCFLDVALNFASLAVAFGVSVRNGHFEPHNCLSLADNSADRGDGICGGGELLTITTQLLLRQF